MESCPDRVSRRQLLALIGAAAGSSAWPAWATDGPVSIAPQPYFAAVNRALQALSQLGAPLAAEDAQRIAALAARDDAAAVEAAEAILDRYTLARVDLEADGYAHIAAGGAPRTLIEQGWALYLVRVANPPAGNDRLHVATDSWFPSTVASSGAQQAGIADTLNVAPLIAKNWLLTQFYDGAPLTPALSGFAIEYRVIQLYSRDRGARRGELVFFTAADPYAAYIASSAQRRRGLRVTFDCLPTQDVALSVLDTDGQGCVASVTIRDTLGRLYPLQAMRLAPDMYFQPQIYRADGETVRLPDGQYTIESRRGPEYLRGAQVVRIAPGERQIKIRLQRWIDPADWGWYSGDPHIHGGGCAHYERPTEGIAPESMIRQVRGEGLSIGQILSWGPSWYYQKQFFTGHAQSPPAALEQPVLQAAINASLQPRPTAKDAQSQLRYDVEVSGFPSSHCGHTVLLRLREQDYPGTQRIEDWPSWNLPILKWAKAQGAVVGYAHCGAGLVVDSNELPNYEIPPLDAAGMQEAIVDVTHGVTDFIAGCDTQPLAELNAWYHLLNCGFRLALIGETDYPCIADERPGVGRTYVQLEQRPADDAGYEAWIRNVAQGRVYCGDGRSHLLEFRVNGHRGGDEDLLLKSKARVNIEALVAARLEPEVPADIQAIKNAFLNGWHLENARIGNSREVPVELVVNGIAVDKLNLLADGKPRRIAFDVAVERSSWIALRILPSSHTYPVFVQVGHKPIRASRRSAQWCRSCVDRLWETRASFIRPTERDAAAQAFQHAREVYDVTARECEMD